MDDKLLPSFCQLMITNSHAGKEEDEDDEEEEDGEMEDGKDDEEDEEDEDGDEDIDISKKFGFLVRCAELNGNSSFLSAVLSPSPPPSTSPAFKAPKKSTSPTSVMAVFSVQTVHRAVQHDV